MVPGGATAGVPGATGRPRPTGVARPGPRGGEAARAHPPTGLAGLLDPGALLPHGRRGLDALPVRRPLVSARRSSMALLPRLPRMDSRLRRLVRRTLRLRELRVAPRAVRVSRESVSEQRLVLLCWDLLLAFERGNERSDCPRAIE